MNNTTSLLVPMVREISKQGVGRSPWTAADALVGLFGLNHEPDQGVRRGQGRPPHQDLCGKLLGQETRASVPC